MWAFEDKGNRPVCLIPEVTGLVQELWRDDWSKRERSKRIFYTSRCYRYERPQAGRYREFTQFGCEILGNVDKDEARVSVINALLSCLNRVGVRFEFVDSVKRGLSYYVEDGFEAISEQLGAQKQIAGGGRYAEGIGWAIGVDRLLLAREQNNDESS